MLIECNKKIVETIVSLHVEITFIASAFSFTLIQIFVNSKFKIIFIQFILIICFNFVISNWFHFMNKSIYFLTKLYGTSLFFIVSHGFEWSISIPPSKLNNHPGGIHLICVHPLQHAFKHPLPIR